MSARRRKPWARAGRAALVLSGLVALSFAPTAAADTAESLAELQRARGLARTTRSWSDRRQVLTLRIDDGRGNERVRKLVMLTRRDGPGEEKTLAVFLEPADVRGSAFLQHVPAGGSSSQWLYLPELGRTRQISSSAKRQSFMGTDFAYADLDLIENALQWTDAEADARRIGAEPPTGAPAEPGGAPGTWFELRPKAEDMTYERVLVKLSGEEVLLRGMMMFGSGDAPEKVLHFDAISDVDGIPTPHRLDMSRPDRGTRTRVTISGVEYDRGLGEELFTKRALERGLDHVE